MDPGTLHVRGRVLSGARPSRVSEAGAEDASTALDGSRVPETYVLAAKRGFKIQTSPAFTPLDVLSKSYAEYRQAWRESHGTDHGADICLNKIIYVADSSRQARDDMREPIRWFFQKQASLIADAAGVPPAQSQ